MQRRLARHIAVGLAAVVGSAGLAVSAIVAPGLPAEGGDGISVAASNPQPVRLSTDVAVTRPAARVVAFDPSVSYIATLRSAVSYSSSPYGPVVGTLPAADPFGAPEVVALVSPPAGDGWIHIDLPVRPDGSTGWIKSDQAVLTDTTFRVAVSIAGRSLTVTDKGRTVLTTPVAVGKPSTPTPTGRTYLWELIRPTDPNGAYGPYIFGLAWFSNAYAEFNGGDAQIGIHGQDEPWSIGQAVSHGCVRLPNNVITTLAGMLPLGTPVTIS